MSVKTLTKMKSHDSIVDYVPFSFTAQPRNLAVEQSFGLETLTQDVWGKSRRQAARQFALNLARLVDLDDDSDLIGTLERVDACFLISDFTGRPVRGIAPLHVLPTYQR